MEEWYPFNEGRTIGQMGSENDLILRDEEHPHGARITLEHDGSTPFAITCGIYECLVHTRFFSDEGMAQSEFEKMKVELERILEFAVSGDGQNEAELRQAVSARIFEFVERFP